MVIEVADEHRIGFRELVIDLLRKEIIIGNPLRDPAELPRPVSEISAIDRRIEFEDRFAPRIDGNRGLAGQLAEAGILVRHERDVGDPLTFAQPLIAAKEEGAVLDDGAARRKPELVPPKSWFRLIEEIPRIQHVIAQK